MIEGRYFVDTNVLIYAVDKTELLKRPKANRLLDRLWQDSSGCLSWQVLNEFYVNATRKSHLQTREARLFVEAFVTWRPIEMTFGLVERAWFWGDQAKLSYWDALIVAAAERAQCQWLLTEDMQAGRKLGELTIVNPFATDLGEFGN